jgi:competence protein ComGF
VNKDQQEDQQNEWQLCYKAALLELDPVKLPQRIEQAYSAIQNCLNAHRNGNSAEYQALADALANLRVLRREIAPNTSESPDQAGSQATSP